MKAVVLTFDRYRTFADHVIAAYGRLWPDHPFVFRIPYQELMGPSDPRREYRPTPVGIRQTVLTLLEDLGDDEWIFWCIDDKYPMALDVPAVSAIGRWLDDADPPSMSGVLFCRCRHMWDQRYLTGSRITDPQGREYLERSNYAQIWIHQFVRAGVIRHLFERMPEAIPHPRYMDRVKARISKPAGHRLFVTRRNLATFGESTVRGTVTRNCRRSLAMYGLQAPAWATDTTAHDHVKGTWRANSRDRLRACIAKLTGRPRRE